MGLDMFARAHTDPALRDKVVDFKPGDAGEELAYWRKHHDLHGWMEALYRTKGGVDEEFNVANLRLDIADLDMLEKSIRLRALPGTTGFFFGNNPPNDESDAEDLAFIAKAREAIAAGKVVVYHAWF